MLLGREVGLEKETVFGGLECLVSRLHRRVVKVQSNVCSRARK
jgi:hypothetical protein